MQCTSESRDIVKFPGGFLAEQPLRLEFDSKKRDKSSSWKERSARCGVKASRSIRSSTNGSKYTSHGSIDSIAS